MYLHRWNGTTGNNTDWPGINLTTDGHKETIEGKDVYTIELKDCANFILSNGGDSDKTGDLTSANYKNGKYYWMVNEDGKAADVQTDAIMTLYTYNFLAKVADGVTLSYIYLFSGSTNLTGAAWPGIPVTGAGNVYAYTHKSFHPEIGVIFNQGNGNPQTGDLWAVPGDNNYYIASIGTVSGHGEGQKTNNDGYTTYTCYSPLTIPSGIAYYATDNHNGSATAHALTNPAASTSMLIHGEPNTIYHFAKASTGTDYTATNAFKAIKVEGEETGKNLETGSGPFNYILNGNAFYEANNRWVGKDKAYLQLSQAATARVLLFDDEEETTGITSIKSENRNIYFDLQGRRVAQPAKGLYIVNGKKYFAK